MARQTHLLRILIIGALFPVACAGNVAQPSQRPTGQPFELRAGESAAIEGGLRLTFDRVTSDSRCPMDALCIWAGDAIAAVSLSQGGSPSARELHTEPSRSEASYLTYSIKLIALAPYPRSDREIRPGDYVATLAVTAR